MRKLAVLAAAIAAVMVLSAVAYAAQVNTYEVTGSTSPAKPGTKKKGVPISLDFDYTVGEQTGQRPSPVKRYTIGFYGMKSNGALFPKCTAAQINQATNDKTCPKGSLVGQGSIINAAGNSADPADTSVKCNLKLKIYNGGQGRAALFLYGGPPECVITISQAIDMRYVSAFGGKGQALQFDVPANLLHPITGIDNAVVRVQSTINKVTRKVKQGGKKVTRGYYESVGCKGKTRPLSVTFLTEAGQSSTAVNTARC